MICVYKHNHLQSWLMIFIEQKSMVYIYNLGAVVIVILWWLNLQLPVQSVPITT
jgi:hypothetical protein